MLKTYYFLIVLLGITIIYAFEVIYSYCISVVEILYNSELLHISFKYHL